MAIPDPAPVMLSASIDFPAYVAMTEGPVPLTVRVTALDEAAPVAQTMPVQFIQGPPETIEVVVSAEGFEERAGEYSRVLSVAPDGASQPAIFLLAPQSPGIKRIVVDFYQRGRAVGSTSLQSEVQSQASKQTASPLPAVFEPLRLELHDDATPPADLLLRVTVSHDRRQLSYRLHSANPELGYRWQPLGSVALSEEPSVWTAEIMDEVDSALRPKGKAATKGDREDPLRRLDALALRLGEVLLSPELRQELARLNELRDKGLAQSLLLISDESSIPWELLKTDAQADFLCLRFRLGRWLAGPKLPGLLRIQRVAWTESRANTLRANAAAAPYFSDLARRLPLQAGQPLNSRQALLDELEAGHTQLLHLTGMASFVPNHPDRSVVMLGDGSLPLEQLVGQPAAGLAHSRPLVFLNPSTSDRAGWTATSLAGWAEAFIRAGATAFVGPLWDVHDLLGAQFAVHFYDQLWAGQPLGEAFYQARAYLRERAPNEPAWLAYVLWGDPNLRVELAPSDGSGAGYDAHTGTGTGNGRDTGTGTVVSGGFSFTTGPLPPLANDARVWFVSANPKEGTDWDQAFALGRPVHWTKVSNKAGQRAIEQTRAGDLALAYSSSPRQEIVGLARITQDADEQPDGHWAVWIEPLVHLERGVTLEELRKTTPDLAHLHNPMSSFSPVTLGQYRTLRELLVERNPDQRDLIPLASSEAAPALSWSPPLFSGDLIPGGRATVQYALSNKGTAPLRRREPLTIEATWRLADQPADQEPSGRQEWRLALNADLPPGEGLPVADLSLDLPDTAGSYRVEWLARADLWGDDMQPATTISQIDVGSPVQLSAPAHAAVLALDPRPPATLWPGQHFEVTGLVTNSGVEAWGVREVQADASVHTPPTAAASLNDSPRWLPPAQPGDTLRVPWEGAAPEQPGSSVLSVTVSRIEPDQPPLELARLESALVVLDMTTLPLARLTEEAPADLPAGVRAQRVQEIGRRLADPAVDAQVRSQTAHAHLLPSLSDADASVSRAALAALASLRSLDATLDAALAEGLAASDQTQRALPELVQDPALPADTRRWLEARLPQEVEERQNSQGQTVLVLPAYVASVQPDLRAPEHTAVVEISPKEVTLRYDGEDYASPNAMAQPGWQDQASIAEAESPRAYGALLFEAIFNTKHSGGKGPTLEGYFTARKQARRRLRIELRIDPEVGSHGWEYLCNPFEQVGNQPAPPLAVYADAPLFRFYPNIEAATAVQAKPLRILVAICNPADLGPDQGGPSYVRNLTRLDTAGLARQMDAIKPALDRLHTIFDTEHDILGAPGDAQPVTFARLTQKLKEGWHVLHIVAHGVMVKERYYLIMEDEQRRSQPVPPEAFEMPAFRQHLRLAVLSSCQSAVRERDAQQNLPSLAERLVRQGLQAVIAMQDVISIDADQLFVQRFYEELARSGRIDMAMASARFDLYRDKPHGRDWGYPALFMSTEDGALLEVAPAPPGSAGHERTPLEEIKRALKPLEEDPGLPARVLSNSIQGRVQAVTDDAQLLSRLAAAIAPHAIQQAVKAPPLARRQVRADLEPLQAVQFDGAELAGFVRDDPNNPMKVPERVFHQIAAALNGGKHVVLTGAPGTGKTTLAEYVCRYARDKAACARGYVLTTATSDWTTFDTVGGLVPAESGVLQFQPGTVLEAISSGRWLILDEINRAEIDKAFGELFTVLSGQAVQLAHKVEGQRVRILPWRNAPDDQHFDYSVHPSWRIIGTMNVYDKSYLFNMSFAFMRRFAFVDLDLPTPDQYGALVDGWLDQAGVTPAMGRLSLKDWLAALLRQDSRLMLRRAIGPAIARDVVRYIGQRAGAQPTSPLDLLAYLAEAFQLYVTPQLDNLDRPGIGGIYQDIDSLFQDLKGSAASDEQRSTHALTLLRIRQLYPHIPVQDWDEFLSSQGS